MKLVDYGVWWRFEQEGLQEWYSSDLIALYRDLRSAGYDKVFCKLFINGLELGTIVITSDFNTSTLIFKSQSSNVLDSEVLKELAPIFDYSGFTCTGSRVRSISWTKVFHETP